VCVRVCVCINAIILFE